MNTKGIVSAIRELGISQNEAARKMNISSATLSLIVRGKREPKVSTFKRICTVLGRKAEELW